VRISFYVYLILALIGVYMSIYLVDLHISVNYAGGGDDATCAFGAQFSCAALLKSSLAKVFGIPIAVYGLAFYISVAVVVCLYRFLGRHLPSLPTVFLAGALAASLYSIFLLVAGKATIGKFCIRCMGLYAVNISLLVTAWLAHPEGGKKALSQMHRIFAGPGLWATLLVLAIATPSIQYTYARKVDAAINAQVLKKRSEMTSATQFVEVDPGSSPMRGEKEAKVVIVEWADFQCGYCQQMAFSLKAALNREPTLFRYHFKNFPLTNCSTNVGEIHRSCAAAIAFNCAKAQGKPWEMHDTLFENNHALADSNLLEYANNIGMDVEVFRACLKAPDAIKALSEDIDLGKKLKLESTPTWYINGIRQVGPVAPTVILSMVKTAQEVFEASGKAKRASPPTPKVK
jgi:protein-disulfide isomerase/uncharacterized membrane protein